MLDDVTIESFRPHVGETFRVEAPDGQLVTLTLSEVSTTATDDDRRRARAPFSIIFRPASGQILRQGMYRMEGGPGTIDVFLVPIMPDREGPRIQAVFG